VEFVSQLYIPVKITLLCADYQKKLQNCCWLDCGRDVHSGSISYNQILSAIVEVKKTLQSHDKFSFNQEEYCHTFETIIDDSQQSKKSIK
jgi:hypothetical protein